MLRKIVARVVKTTAKRAPRLPRGHNENQQAAANGTQQPLSKQAAFPSGLALLKSLLNSGSKSKRLFAARLALVLPASPVLVASCDASRMRDDEVLFVCSGGQAGQARSAAKLSPLLHLRFKHNVHGMRKSHLAPFNILALQAQRRAMYRLLTRRHADLSKEVESGWLRRLTAVATYDILVDCGATHALALTVAQNESLFQGVISQLQLVPWASSMSVKIVFLISGWEGAGRVLQKLEGGRECGMDLVGPVFALLLLRAAPGNLEQQVKFVVDQLELLGQEESQMSERACITAHLIQSMDSLKRIANAMVIQRAARRRLAPSEYPRIPAEYTEDVCSFLRE